MKKMFIAISLLFSLTITSVNAVEVSQEAKITGLYVAFFNRAADQAGLEYWTTTADNVAKQGGDVSSVFKKLSAGFATHPTFKSTYEHLNNEAFVSAIYKNSLGRDGDAGGIAYWTDLIDRAMSRPDMVATFVELAMVTDLTAEKYKDLSAEDRAAGQLRQDLITNKATVAVAFTKQLEELSNVENNNDPESDPAYIASIMIISGVTEDKTTVDSALGFLAEIKESADPVVQINGANRDDGRIIYSPDSNHSISNVTFSPPSSASILLGENVDFTYDYETDESRGVLIFAHPFTNGAETPGASNSGSREHPAGNGSASSSFSISTTDQHVDQVRFQITDPGHVLLYETFVPVDYSFTSSGGK